MDTTRSKPQSATEKPRPNDTMYQKPILRKYDQIGQVKPYGPSEFEAG